MSGFLYLEHFSDSDRALLARLTGDAETVAGWLSNVQQDPRYFDRVLGRQDIFRSLFAAGEEEGLLRASPFLIFALSIHRAAHDLDRLPFVEEWVGPGRRVPMFEVAGLRDFAAGSLHRLFAAELLASYTHVASGSFWVQTPRGWQRRRYSELDPMRLIEILNAAPEADKPLLYRRLGDLALFLTGVFPDWAGSRMLPGRKRRRLEQAIAWVEVGQTAPLLDDMVLLEQLGSRAYRAAWRSAAQAGTGAVLGDVAESFRDARRFLNFVTDRYLYPFREQWFRVGELEN